ncbi:MAG: hypothetical protein ACE5GB_06285, partial [Acidimicrobiales bacterium]
RAIGVPLELTLQGTSPWATEPISASTGDSSFSAPVRAEHLEDYDAFVTTLVRRYTGAGPPVVSILMVGNEIEVPSHWATNGTDDNPATQAAYLDLVARTRSLVAAIDPGLVVARASTNFGPAFDDLPNAARVTERLNGRASSADLMTIVQDALGRSDTYDAFGVHPNNGVDGVEGIATFVSELLPETKLLIAEDMRSTLVSSPLEPGNWPDLNGNGLEDVVEVLDTGRAVAGLDPATATEQYRAAQSDTLVEKVVLAAASGYDTVFVSSLFDFGPGYSIVTWRYAGLVDFDTDRRQVEPRPAYHAYRELIGLLTGASPGPVTRAGETVRVDFEAPAGDFAVSWGPGSTVESADRYWRFPRFAGEETLIPLDVEEALSEPGPVVAMT